MTGKMTLSRMVDLFGALLFSTQRAGQSVFTKRHVDRARRARRNRIARASRRRNRS